MTTAADLVRELKSQLAIAKNRLRYALDAGDLRKAENLSEQIDSLARMLEAAE